VSGFSLKINQSAKLYRALDELQSDKQRFDALTGPQRRVVESQLREMRLSGASLTPGSLEQQRSVEIKAKLSTLKLKFKANVMDGIKSVVELVTDKKELEGCPEHLLKTMAEAAVKRELVDKADADTGPWAVTIDAPTYTALMKSCSNRKLRETMCRHRRQVGSSHTEFNNEPIMQEMLQLRREFAQLVGMPNFASLSIATKMARTPEAASRLIHELKDASYDKAKQQFEELAEFARTILQMDHELRDWDISYVSSKHRKHLFKYNDEDLKPYFAFPRVIQGLFDLVHEKFGVSLREVTDPTRIPTWHPDVKVFEGVDDATGSVVAYFYGDFYVRPGEKEGGAWMNPTTSRRRDPVTGEIQVPIVHVASNQPVATADTESLMTFRNVKMLFHEFGHALQHTLTTIDEPLASGINGVEWDFVEVASQFMENFCREPEVLRRIGVHHKTGEPMPEDMQVALHEGTTHMASTVVLRKLYVVFGDLAIHGDTTRPVLEVTREIRKPLIFWPATPDHTDFCSNMHSFVYGGYAAGIYSYMWSVVYSADAYAAFEEAHTEDEKRAVAKRYRDTILGLGAGVDPHEVWHRFRGRACVDVRHYLRHSGLV
jgi:oligopeptidase A